MTENTILNQFELDQIEYFLNNLAETLPMLHKEFQLINNYEISTEAKLKIFNDASVSVFTHLDIIAKHIDVSLHNASCFDITGEQNND